MARHRVGVALLLPQPVSTEVDVLRRAVGAKDVELLPPHLTLVPPVNVRAEDMDAAFDLLRDAAARTEPFRLVLGPTRTFLPINPVLFLEVGGDVAQVDALRDKIFRPPLERRLMWPFQPHITILESASEEQIRAAADVLSQWRAELVVDRVHLLREEHHHAGGRMWRPMFEATFGGPSVVGRGGLELELDTGEHGYAGQPLAVTARRDGRVVGGAFGWTDGAAGRLADVHVEPDVRGEGIGAHLVAAFAAAAAERGVEVLTAATGNPFLERLGFVDGRRELS